MSVYFTTVIKRVTIQTINYKRANSVDSSGLKTLRHYESQSCFKSTSAVIQGFFIRHILNYTGYNQ